MIRLICVVLLVVIQYVHSDNSEDTKCPPKWTKFQETCYRIYNRPVTFSAAEVGCQDDFGGRLAIVNSKEKSDFIRNEYFTPNNKFRKNTWIALIRKEESNIDSSFQWLDKSPLTFSNWQHGEPNNFWGLQYCVALWGGQKHPASWYDYWCDTEMFALCERDLNPKTNSSRLDSIAEDSIENSSAEENNNFIWILLIVTSVSCIILLIVVIIVCCVADFGRAKRAVSSKTDVWFKRFSEDRISLGNNNIANNNYFPQEKVLNKF